MNHQFLFTFLTLLLTVFYFKKIPKHPQWLSQPLMTSWAYLSNVRHQSVKVHCHPSLPKPALSITTLSTCSCPGSPSSTQHVSSIALGWCNSSSVLSFFVLFCFNLLWLLRVHCVSSGASHIVAFRPAHAGLLDSSHSPPCPAYLPTLHLPASSSANSLFLNFADTSRCIIFLPPHLSSLITTVFVVLFSHIVI